MKIFLNIILNTKKLRTKLRDNETLPSPILNAMPVTDTCRQTALDLINFIDASPTPWHAVATMESQLLTAGFTRLHETARWQLAAGEKYFVARGGASLVAFIVGTDPLADAGLRLVGAHTDSPGLRLKPQPALKWDGLLRLAVEVYGGPILATFADRDLSLAGRIVARSPSGTETRLLRFDTPLLRLPNLAIHMNRDVNEQGLKFNKQTELPLMLGSLGEGEDAAPRLHRLLADAAQIDAADLLSWELAAYDTQPGCLWGLDEAFIASRQLDNLASCHAALQALIATQAPAPTCLAGFFDHEEVGSESATGAGGSFLADVLARIATAAGLDDEDRRRTHAQSFFISADMAHAYQPNFPNAYEPGHKVRMNGGPVIKSNANQRYTSNAETAARFKRHCEQAGVPYQQYAHRADLGCGSTIGPMVAAQLGIPGVDVGSPLWAMHSIRESAGVQDHAAMIAALTAAYRG